MANGGSKMYYPPRDVYRAPKTPSQMLDSQTWKIIYGPALLCICCGILHHRLRLRFTTPIFSSCIVVRMEGFLCHCPPDCRGKCIVNRIGCHIASFGDSLVF